MTCKEIILSDNYADFIVDFLPPEGYLRAITHCYEQVSDIYNILHLDRNILPPISMELYDYQNTPKLFGLMQDNFDPISLIESGIVQVQRPPLSLTGSGVIIAFIDTGIDYTNEVFRDRAGRSRILAIWDQSIQEGTPPEGILYGSEYTREQIDEALVSDTPYDIVPSRDVIGHGTNVASVAAGSSLNNGTTFLGAAPRADIVVVKLKECKQYLREYYLLPEDVPAYQGNDIMMGVRYAESFAVTFERPVVICIALGTNMGDHSGNISLARYLESVAVKRSRGIVVCGGNEGNAAHHFEGQLTVGTGAVNNYQDVEIRVAAGQKGFFLELWGSVPDVFNISIRSPGGESIPRLRLGVGQSVTYSFIYESTRVTIDSVLVETGSGEELIIFRFQEPTEGIWTIRVFADGIVHNGVFNMWLPITQFMSAETVFLEPNPYTTLTEPSATENVITVSTYNDSNNSFFLESGRGFARGGVIKPDLAAPGVNISTINGKQTGSCYAGAITAGAVAQFMEWAIVRQNDILISSNEIKNYFVRGASRAPDVVYPNREWGYGRLNLAGTFDTLAGV